MHPASPRRPRPFTLLRCLPVLALLLGGPAAARIDFDAVSAPARGDVAAMQRAHKLWQALPRTQNGCPKDFDYFPQGGMRNFYCHLRTQISWVELQRLSPVKVFLKGPHTAQQLNLKSRGSFGFYNPEFVRWLAASFIPSANDTAFRHLSQPIYDQSVQRLARIFFVTHQKLHKNPDYLKQEAHALLATSLKQGEGEAPYEKWFYFMNPKFFSVPQEQLMDDGFDGGWDGNVVKTAVAFWVRRSLDGTDGEFFAALKQLLGVYDPGFMSYPVP